MKTLIVEDNFVNRKYLLRLLQPFGECDIAVNGREAVNAFQVSLDSGRPYDLICMDIMMPEMDGQEALKIIRQIEADHKIQGLDVVKILMTTAVDERKMILNSFDIGCEGYLIKPIEPQKLYQSLKELGLIEENSNPFPQK